jgi:glycosyltransferase involved in cell wall biosynthesis
MAESLACATPVLGFPEGAAPEIVDHGVTGYLCRDEADMVARCDQLGALDRGACRAAAESRFSVGRMAADHEALYRRILDRVPVALPRPTLVAGA